MAWCRPGDKPLSEPMMVRLPTHISVTRPQWVIPVMYPSRLLRWKTSNSFRASELILENIGRCITRMHKDWSYKHTKINYTEPCAYLWDILCSTHKARNMPQRRTWPYRLTFPRVSTVGTKLGSIHFVICATTSKQTMPIAIQGNWITPIDILMLTNNTLLSQGQTSRTFRYP